MKGFLTVNHKFPKRLDNYILAYYADNNVVILRKQVKRSILAQNIKIRNKQPYLCALWGEMTFNIKSLFADYAKAYKISTQQKRAQGVSGFSIFISFVYRLQRRYKIEIEEMTRDLIYSVFMQFNSLKKLMKESLLLCLNTRLYSQYKKLIYIAKSIVNNLYTEGDTESVFHLKKTRESQNLLIRGSDILNGVLPIFVCICLLLWGTS